MTMAYEKEAIESPTPTITPQSQVPVMKEDKVVESLSHKSGQLNITETKEAPKEESTQLSPRVAALARQEQKYRQQERALKEREKSLEEKAAKLAKLEAMEAKLTQKDYSALEEMGGSYEGYTQYLLDKQSSADPQAVALKEIKTELEAVKKAQVDEVSKRFDAAVQERRLAVKALVDTNTEYSTIKEKNMQEAVVQHILDTWENDNIDLTPEQAAKEVEEALVERAKSWSSISKLKPQAAPEAEKKPLPALKGGLKTLTNQMATSSNAKPFRSFEGLSDAERYAEAYRRALEKTQQQG
jgi:hypothetical protein